MTFTTSQTKKILSYTDRTVKRAETALCCSSFYLTLFAAMCNQSVPLQIIAGQSGVDRKYTKKIVSEAKAESDLVWLIEVGLLRREVDGQGLTDSFRLTPLGRHLVTKWENREGFLPTPSLWQRIDHLFHRWFKIP